MKEFWVDFVMSERGHVVVRADSADEARSKVFEMNDLSDRVDRSDMDADAMEITEEW